ncbi:energy-coupling factor transport system permease protein [Psychromicrobium silvestre]|uniref:Energy-coupling factor transport system permease protein n=1 Tax=Psychromicrobium silvestre TaxID=1645614 RepID=A0A7Y9S6W0_9MICC|nr:energy-coupling factor transporter transmembrane component T [Psychromicrobium silvestre]NYE95689.1 energy-coupling factor transport system permease protein [Psychromicrobium silvestre]
MMSRSQLLTRANPLSKLTAVGVLTLALALSVDWVSGTVVLLCLLLVFPLSGVPLRTLLRRVWPLVFALLLAAWGTSLASADSGRTLLDWGYVTISEGSLATGVAIGVRGFAIALPAAMLVLTTDPSDLATALAQKWHLPARFVMGTLAAMRLTGVMAEEWQTLSMARRARGVGASGSVLSRIRANLGQAMALLIQSVRRATRLATTMEARGFGSNQRTWARESAFSARDVGIIAFGVLVAAAAVTVSMALGAWNVVWSR